MSVNGVASGYSAQNPNGSQKNSITSGVDMNSFFKLMVAQLQNQSMYDNVDNSQFITQMAQFSMLSQMETLSKSVQTSSAVSFLGKTATVVDTDADGKQQVITGTVSEVNYVDGTPYLTVGDHVVTLDSVTKITQTAVPSGGSAGA